MNVVFGQEQVKELKGKYTLLEMDTLLYKDDHMPITCYAVISPGDIMFDQFTRLKHMLPVHTALLKNYKLQQWDFCKNAIEQLIGNICPFMDEFYIILQGRINGQIDKPSDNWTNVVDVT
jgi:hypothetical protein